MNNELMHYGVLGMRWGVHRAKMNTTFGKRAKALHKTNRMLDKYDRRMQRHLLKVKANELSPFESNNYKAKHYAKATRYAEAAKFVYDKMESTFSDTTLGSLANRRGVSYGERYAAWLMYTYDEEN